MYESDYRPINTGKLNNLSQEQHKNEEENPLLALKDTINKGFFMADIRRLNNSID